jgi:signal transduction histidine kinase/CheY-like chemotaxis protein
MRFKTLQVIHRTENARNEAEIAHLRNVELEREVSERKQIEAALRESEARFRLVMEESPINISLYAPDGTMLYGNRAWRETWQPVDDSDDGFNLLEADLIHHLGLVDLVQHAFGGEEVHVEELVIHPEQFARVKQTMWLRAHAYGLRDDDGVLKNVVLMIEDITKQKQTEAALRQAHKMESLGKLAGGIAHDFNNLLVAILTQSSLAYYKSSPKSPAREHIRKVERVAEQAAELSRQMLAYSGRGHFMLDTIDLNQLILESEALLSTVVPRQTEFVTRLAPNLPRIQADPDQLRLVLTNLLLNAGESFGGSPGKVIVATGRRTLKETSEKYAQYTGQPLPAGEYLYLTVEDDAAGMPPESLPHIFDPFFSTKGEGHGLGLSVVLGIVRGHKGGLFLESSSGEGSRFELLFPVSDIEARATPEAEAREPSMGKVLVIDDEDSVREAIVDILSMEEIEVIEAEDGPTGLSRYREFGEEVNLVVLDLSMPGMSGQETFQELLKIDPDVQVLLSSGFTESEILDRFDKRKPAGFLQKPYNIAQFLNTVGEFL